MTTTTPHDVLVPAGARPDSWENGPWQNGVPLSHRVLLGETRRVNGRRDYDIVEVQPTAMQFSDGRIDVGSVYEPPQVDVGDHGYTAVQARELAAAIIEAADEVDGGQQNELAADGVGARGRGSW